MEPIQSGAELLQISANQVDEVLGEFGGNLLLGAIDEMEADMRLHNLAHQAVDASADRGKQHELAPTILVAGEGPLDGVELAAQSAHALQKLDVSRSCWGMGLAP